MCASGHGISAKVCRSVAKEDCGAVQELEQIIQEYARSR